MGRNFGGIGGKSDGFESYSVSHISYCRDKVNCPELTR